MSYSYFVELFVLCRISVYMVFRISLISTNDSEFSLYAIFKKATAYG